MLSIYLISGPRFEPKTLKGIASVWLTLIGVDAKSAKWFVRAFKGRRDKEVGQRNVMTRRLPRIKKNKIGINIEKE